MRKTITNLVKVQIIALTLFISFSSFAQHGRTPKDQTTMNTEKFGNDVIINPDPTKDQRNVKVAVAFNGWIYSAYTSVDVAANTGGITVEVSKDNGATWTVIDSYNPNDVRYEDFDITVAGTTTSTIVVYIVGVRHDLTAGTYILFIDKYDGDTGAWVGSPLNKSFTYKVASVALATDYRFPSYISAPYSVGLAYSVSAPAQDSVKYTVSTDGGVTFGSDITVIGTFNYLPKVSLAYGRSWNYSNGRYFIAYLQTNTSIAQYGHVYTAHNISSPISAFTNPYCLDSAQVTSNNYCRNPKISCQFNDTDNDSSNVTSVVMVDRLYPIYGDIDVVGFYSKTSVNTNNWYPFDLQNSPNWDTEPDISYDPTYNNFLVTYFDSTAQTLPYVVQGFNFLTPTIWGVVTTQYNDAGGLIKPFPKVVINPSATQAVFVWNKEGVGSNGVSMFDNENLFINVNEVPEENFAINSIMPNPSSGNTQIALELLNDQNVSIEIFSLTGQKVMDVANQNFSAGKQLIGFNVSELEAGYYMCKIQSGETVKIKKLSVIH